MPASSYDATIGAIADTIGGSNAPRSIDDVVEVMRSLDRALADHDGVKWFNFLYLRVTESVRNQPAGDGWKDPKWLERLDVVFAGLYFRALAAWARDRGAVARCWEALFEARWRNDVAKIQFALAGMNAHINHDLALALVLTSEERGTMPDRDSAQHADFERVNALLERVEEEVKVHFLTGIAGELDRHFGRVDDVIAMWKVGKARDTAWDNGEILWELRPSRLISDRFMRNLDRLVGLSSKGLLVPTDVTRSS